MLHLCTKCVDSDFHDNRQRIGGRSREDTQTKCRTFQSKQRPRAHKLFISLYHSLILLPYVFSHKSTNSSVKLHNWLSKPQILPNPQFFTSYSKIQDAAYPCRSTWGVTAHSRSSAVAQSASHEPADGMMSIQYSERAHRAVTAPTHYRSAGFRPAPDHKTTQTRLDLVICAKTDVGLLSVFVIVEVKHGVFRPRSSPQLPKIWTAWVEQRLTSISRGQLTCFILTFAGSGLDISYCY